MRETFGESWTIQIVAAFILLFVSFFALIISYSKTFKTKNEVISIIEKYEGLTTESKQIIQEFLQATNYRGSGKCESGYKAFLEEGGKAKYCVKAEYVKDMTLVKYEVVMFYNFYIPAFGNIASFKVTGTTVDLGKGNYHFIDWI